MAIIRLAGKFDILIVASLEPRTVKECVSHVDLFARPAMYRSKLALFKPQIKAD
jgi:hypothetical protein